MTISLKNTVVVPIDFSEESFKALQCAMDFVEDGSHIHLVHVLPSLSPMEPGVIWGSINDEERTKHATDALREGLSDAKYKDVSVHIGFGNPAKAITKYATDIKADLIVLPSHGRTGTSHALLGSVAEHVVRYAHCPTYVLRNHI